MTYKLDVREHERGGLPVAGYSRIPAGSMLGGDFIAPGTSDDAKRAILAGRGLLYASKGEALKRAIMSGNSLVDGAAQILAMIIEGIQQKLGPLSPADLQATAVHLAGTIVEVARDNGDPEATEQDGAKATRALTQRVVAMLQAEPATDGQAQLQPAAPQGVPLLTSAGGQNV